MNRPCTLYDAAGRFAHTMEMPDQVSIDLNTPEGWTAKDGHYPETSYLQGGEVVLMQPAPPGRHWVFDIDTEAWIDPRTAADRQAALYAARAAAKADKSNLLMALRSIGILTGPEALQAAMGQVPASFEAAIAALPEDTQDLARIRWAGDQHISRMHPLIVLAAYARDITDDQLDAMFGVQIPD